ncbi:hypothetical protein WIV_gp141 [Wiseana iridescent virus]|uniref:Uncharacterized protein n=1 Tax=Wiseana iridescent virus TaxID=68347 RepID=G0T5G7_IRV9|nr:hypothetical protein WIV_gp141 [Wiseana iridescent virus]ADO00485.1 hypothetical protein [Wiseana iridescent virus]
MVLCTRRRRRGPIPALNRIGRRPMLDDGALHHREGSLFIGLITFSDLMLKTFLTFPMWVYLHTREVGIR